jgi:mevalonate pyrophosphate decarboxylase
MRSTERLPCLLRETRGQASRPRYGKLQFWLERCKKGEDYRHTAFYHVLFPNDVPKITVVIHVIYARVSSSRRSRLTALTPIYRLLECIDGRTSR